MENLFEASYDLKQQTILLAKYNQSNVDKQNNDFEKIDFRDSVIAQNDSSLYVPRHVEFDSFFNLYDTSWPISVRIFFTVLYSCTFAMTLGGNISVLLVHRFARHCLSPFGNIRICLLNLALSDMVTGVLCAPFTYVHIVAGKWIFPHWLCPLVQFVRLLSIFVTTNTLMLIGVERATALFYPFSYCYRKMRSMPKILVASTWLFGCIYSFNHLRNFNWVTISNLFMDDNQTIAFECEYFIGSSEDDRKVQIKTNFTFTYAIPFTFLIMTYSAIVIALICGKHKYTQEMFQQEIFDIEIEYRTQNKLETVLQTIQLTLFVIVLYGVCWSPIKLFQLLHEYQFIGHSTSQQFHTQLYIYITFHWLAMANSFLNPLVYTFSSNRYRSLIVLKYLQLVRVSIRALFNVTHLWKSYISKFSGRPCIG